MYSHFLKLLFYYFAYLFSRQAVVTEEEIENLEIPQKNLLYTHKIEPGFTKVQNYGLALAAKTNIPEDTIKLAIELAELMDENETVITST